MRTLLGVIGGGGAGALLGGAVLFAWSRTSDTLLTPALVTIGRPAARVVAWLAGVPLVQEQAIVCYALGIVVTVVLGAAVLGAIAGGLAMGGRRRDRA